MSTKNCIKLLEFDSDQFRKLNTGEKLLILIEAEQTTLENSMILKRQLARIQQLQYECNEMRIFQLESESIPLVTATTTTKGDRKRQREEEARERSRQIEMDMAQGKNVYGNESWRAQKSYGISQKTKLTK